MMNHFTSLPDEILTLIANNLTIYELYPCTLINRQCYRAMNPVLWRSIDIRDEFFFTKLVAGLLSSSRHQTLGRHVRSVDIHVPMTDAHLLLFIIHLTLLQQLKLKDASGITDMGILHLAHTCPQLKTLYISNGSSELTQQAIHTIGERLTHLCSLLLTDCPSISAAGGTFSALKTCPLRILHLDVSALASIENISAATDLVNDLADLPYLTMLLFVDPPRDFNQVLFGILESKESVAIPISGGTMAVPRCWPNLVKFSMTGFNGVDEWALEKFIKRHPGITDLCLDFGPISDSLLTSISTFLPRIDTLSIRRNTGISVEAVRRMVSQCPVLEFVDLQFCRLPWSAFPEAKSHCLDMDHDDDDDDDNHSFDSFGFPAMYIKCLDKLAIRQIQQEQHQQH